MINKLSASLIVALNLLPIVSMASAVICPSIEELKKAQFYIVSYTSSEDNSPIPNQYVAGTEFTAVDANGVSRLWQVMIGVMNAANTSDAQNKLTKVLNNMTQVYSTAKSNDELPDMFKTDDIKLTCYFDTSYKTDPDMFIQPEKTTNPFIQAIEQTAKGYNYPVLVSSPSN